MEFKNILFEVTEDGIGVLTVNRPKALNALNAATLTEIRQCVHAVAAMAAVKVLVITGSGQKSFVAGADIVEMASKAPLDARYFGKLGQDTFTDIEQLPQPVIAAINGFALGGGCELACSCDFRYASDNAIFGQPEVGLGVTPGFGGTQRLPRIVGIGYGKEIIYTGSNMDAAEAYRIGLINKIVSQEDLMPTVMKVAKKIASNAPIAVQLSKAAINRGLQCDIITGIAYEDEVFGLCFATEDQTEGMNAFVEKRKEKHFKGQ